MARLQHACLRDDRTAGPADRAGHGMQGVFRVRERTGAWLRTASWLWRDMRRSHRLAGVALGRSLYADDLGVGGRLGHCVLGEDADLVTLHEPVHEERDRQADRGEQ